MILLLLLLLLFCLYSFACVRACPACLSQHLEIENSSQDVLCLKDTDIWIRWSGSCKETTSSSSSSSSAQPPSRDYELEEVFELWDADLQSIHYDALRFVSLSVCIARRAFVTALLFCSPWFPLTTLSQKSHRAWPAEKHPENAHSSIL